MDVTPALEVLYTTYTGEKKEKKSINTEKESITSVKLQLWKDEH